MGHLTCAPVVTGSTGNYWAVCRIHGWKQGPYADRATATRAKGAHKRAKRTRRNEGVREAR
jgi:hypothetical protein